MGTNRTTRTPAGANRGAGDAVIDLVAGTDDNGIGESAPAQMPGGGQRSRSRERLIEAAGDVFLERGYAGATVNAIARRAGFTTGALYGYFESKDELIGEAIAGAIDELVRGHLENALTGRGPADAAHELLVAVLSEPKDAGHAFVMHGLAAAHGEDSADVVRPQLIQIVEVIRHLLEAGQADGVIDTDVDLDAFLHLAAALMFGSVAMKVLDVPTPDPSALEDVVRRFESAFAPRRSDGDRPPRPRASGSSSESET